MKKYYLVIGSDNFWYSMDSSLKEAKETIEHIKSDPSFYGNPESNQRQSEPPETLYIYKAEEVDRIDLLEDEEDEE